ncbi:MAG: RagB/SusD family nutrient uptake outer membrane protein [Bacteroidota bacterium]
MKLIKIKIFALSALLCVCSCEEGFLDQVPDDRLTEADAFINRNNTEMFLANVYGNVPDEFAQRFVTTGTSHGNSGPWTGASDEAEYQSWSEVPNQINTGNWNPASTWVRTFWQRYYRGIRNATYFIANADQCSECGPDLVRQYKAEARGLRALYHFYLMRMFGPVPLIGDKIIAPDADINTILVPRGSMDECVDFVVSEFDLAAADLPPVASANTFGRMTRSVLMAYKQEVLLLAASPLFNGNTDYANLKNIDGKQLVSQQTDISKWQRAADAAKAYIDEFVPAYHDLFRKNDATGKFSAFLSCRDVMLESWNREWIFGRPSASVQTRQYEMTPYHAGALQESRGGGGLGATQRMVDAYFMDNGHSPILGYNADGTPIVNPSSGYLLNGTSTYQAPDDNQARETFNQWVKREPRFYAAITYDGRRWLNPNTPTLITYTRFTGNSGASQSQWDYSPTGYVVRKNMALGNWNVGGRALLLYRLANVYLNYIEALNEYNPGHNDILLYLNKIRERAGIPEYGSTDLPAPASQDEMREAIRKERRVELGFENVRWFDTRRWKIAEATDNGPFYGLNIRTDPPAFYNLSAFENRVFEKRHYLFPIPLQEVLINKQLVQNTGWTAD